MIYYLKNQVILTSYPWAIISRMCGPTVNHTRQNCCIPTEKLAFEYNKSISAAATNLHQQKPCKKSRIIFKTIPYFAVYRLLY